MRLLKRIDRKAITDGNLIPAILYLAGPMLIGAVLQNVQNLIDLFWVGRLGATSVAAVAMAGTILMLLYPMLMGLALGTIALVSRTIGAGKKDEANQAAAQSLILAFILGCASAAVGWLVSDSLFRWLGAEPDVMRGGSVYLQILFLGSFTMYLLFIGNAALRGAGDTHTPMYIMASANLFNLVLDPLFIFGIGPFPEMGVAGAAVATVLSQAMAASITLFLLVKGKTALHLHRGIWRPRLEMMWRILRVGIPGSGQMLARSIMSVVLMGIVAACGTPAVAAYGIGLRFHYIGLMPCFVLGAAAATLVGQNLGAGKPVRARKAVWMTVVLGISLMAIMVITMIVFAPGLIRLFNKDPEVVTIGVRYLRVVSPFYLFAAVGIILSRGLAGAGDTIAPMINTIVCLWGLQVPLAVYLSRILRPSTDGVWWAIGIALIAQCVFITAWFELGRWKTKKV